MAVYDPKSEWCLKRVGMEDCIFLYAKVARLGFWWG